MQSLGLQSIPSRTLESPENETEAQRLNRLMTQEAYGTEPQRVVAFVYQFAALVILLAAGTIRMYLGGLGWIAVMSLVGWLTIKGARAAAPNAVRTVLKARKFPILYLRPFSADVEIDSNPVPFLWVRTPEKRLVNLFRNRLRCPVAAVADPSEEQGSLGALRVWIHHDVWQDKVREFMRRAPLVILAVGETAGSLWELQEAIRLVDPRRLLIMLPNRKDRDGVAETLNRFLPKPIRTLWRKTRLLAFDADWNPIEVDNPQGVLARYHPVRRVSDTLMEGQNSPAEVDELVGPELPEWRRILGIFVHPTRTFVDIERGNLRWWPPALFLYAGYACLINAIGNRGGWSQLSGDDLNGLRFLYFFVSPVVSLIWVCAASLVLKWTVNRLFGGAAAWNALFAVWMYASLPLAGMLLLGAAMVRWLVRGAFNMADLPFTLAAALTTPAGLGRLVLLAAVLLVHVWFLVLLSLGVAKIADVSRGKGFVSVLGWDALCLAWMLTVLLASHSGSSPSQPPG